MKTTNAAPSWFLPRSLSPRYRSTKPCRLQDLSVSIRAFSGMVVIALVCSCATILGPAKIIPLCAPAQMEVRVCIIEELL